MHRAVAALLLSLFLKAQTQSPIGSIHVEVKDPSGAPTEASGKLTGPVTASFRTDPTGQYTATNLPYGSYQLEISKNGFTTQSIPIEVESATPLRRTVTLALRSTAYKVDVVAATPLPGGDLALNQIPSPVQTATKADIDNSAALDLGDFMNRRLNGIVVNENQSNPFQPDVNYRGYTASPLLGTPEGISVYLDGVRQNQPFGDVVSWDLIPKNAIETVEFMPGSNPLFGLNTLGGALSVQTKDGTTNPGLSAQFTYGSSGRKAGQAEYGGGKAVGFNWFLSGNIFHESGWRFDSPSDVKQAFVRLGWRSATTDLALTSTYVYNALTGNGLQDYRLLAQNYASVYSVPDSINNRAPSFHFIARHTFSNTLTFSGNAWFRHIDTAAINANDNTDVLGGQIYQPSAKDQTALAAAGYTGFPTSGATAANTPFPKWRCIGEALRLADPDENCDGVIVYSNEVQNDFGASGQITWLTKPKAQQNQFTAGFALDRGSVDYTQNTQYGYIAPNYVIVGVPAWQDGSTSADGVPVDSRVSLHGITPNGSVFATDTLTLGKKWNVTLSGRFNRSTIDNSDRINPVAGSGSLDGDYVYERLNPSIGITYNPSPLFTLFANYSQGSRAPTSIELGCADPNNPCSLPNALASDPPLKQVVTTTWEAGVRGKLEKNIRWSLDGFHAINHNDILFLASEELGTGYFQNFGETERQGIQASLDGKIQRFNFGLDYTFLDATYQSTETVDGSANNTSNTALEGTPGLEGVITIHPGNRIPLIPKQSGKAFLDVQATKELVLNFGMIANSSTYARGNENNAYQSDGAYYLGPGVSPGYAVFNFQARYNLTHRWQLGIEIDNLFDRHYYTSAQLANTMLDAQGGVASRPYSANSQGDYPLQSVTFFSPGAPRRAWADLRFRW
jgi:outer membrane receptor protein involved in Fe transport